ncbi:MAG: aminotransferase class III-fold pyridoxal phosphate-dependent enzyme [Prevotellaceae bacterium]|jgi:acetylornithine aminotransferase|nr:aminotransferase class III-fold pyridoxal phosphate-dependent enzyme [Prevotellaceae bacterium]
MNLFDVYNLWNVELKSAEGCYLYDSAGNKYLDLYGGHAVISVGHSHRLFIESVERQMRRIAFFSNSIINREQENYAKKLGELSGYSDYSLFMCNSGAEANENALKLASFKTKKSRVLAFCGAFHGRTSGAVAVTDIPQYRAPYNCSDNAVFVPLNNIEAVRDELKSGEYCAVIIEGIQGVGGIKVPDIDFLQKLSTLCKSENVMLILDEIQSGCGRSGKYFYHQYSGIRPDLITVAKGIGNGFPMAGVLISPEFEPVKGSLGTTFGGAYLACAAGSAVVDIMTNENLMENAAQTGDFICSELSRINLATGKIKELRGKGLMIGIEMNEPVAEIRRKLLFDCKIFTGVSSTNIIRLLPPLCLTRKDAATFIGAFEQILANDR